jgi:hypothetical protein
LTGIAWAGEAEATMAAPPALWRKVLRSIKL